MQYRSIVMGSGSYLPERVVTNAELAERVDTSDDWITTRTGIHERRILKDPGQATSDMAANAINKLLENKMKDEKSY